ncbi:MAG: alpha/beta hydrolase [Verrucomicrobiota bacterium]
MVRALALFAAVLPLTLTAAKDLPRLARTNLLAYRDVASNAQRVKSVEDWQHRRAEIVRGMERMMGVLPGSEKRCALDLKVEEETDCGSYVRRLITYLSEPGGRVPAYLLIPKDALSGKKKAPGILYPHPTDDTIGHKVVVGLGGRANRQYAVELAERGFVTLAPSYPLLVNYQPDLKAFGWESGTLKAVWDSMRGLDLLESLPFVNAKAGFGSIGHSLGGHNSIYTGVFDQRLKDSNFRWDSVDRVATAAVQIYQLHGKPENLFIEHPDCDHDFPDAMRERAYNLFELHLRAP